METPHYRMFLFLCHHQNGRQMFAIVNDYRAFACDVTATMLVFQDKIFFFYDFLLSGTTIWPPSSLLSCSPGTECKRSIRVKQDSDSGR